MNLSFIILPCLNKTESFLQNRMTEYLWWSIWRHGTPVWTWSFNFRQAILVILEFSTSAQWCLSSITVRIMLKRHWVITKQCWSWSGPLDSKHQAPHYSRLSFFRSRVLVCVCRKHCKGEFYRATCYTLFFCFSCLGCFFLCGVIYFFNKSWHIFFPNRTTLIKSTQATSFIFIRCTTLSSCMLVSFNIWIKLYVLIDFSSLS